MLNNKKMINHLTPEAIGIFDSGIGGLTVANAIQQILPAQKLLYVGDTAHCPWGDKSSSQIDLYSIKLTEFLIANNCKLIVIACNTASCISFKILKQKFDNIILFNVIDPVINYLKELNYNNFSEIGIIGTKQTIRSQEYQHRIEQLSNISMYNHKLKVKALATPLFVPLIEEGLQEHPATNLIIENYLSNLNLADHAILILGCTHYPLIKKNIEHYYKKINKQITVIDSTMLVAKEIKNFLSLSNLFDKNYSNPDLKYHNEFYFTENSGFFAEIAKRFFPNIKAKFLPLWN